MSAPRIPGHTCPTIDKLKRRIETAYKLASRVKDSDTEEDLRSILGDIAHELCGEADVLEEIRAANLALREAAEYWQTEAEAA